LRHDVTGIVLAGGSSRRMGVDKAFLSIAGIPMIERVLAALRAACADVIVVTKVRPEVREAFGRLRARIIDDETEEQAPLIGLRAGLRALERPWAFVSSCDLPFLSSAAILHIAALASGYDAAVPRVDDRWHPLHAAYAATALDTIEQVVQSGERRMTSALAALRLREVTVSELRAADPTLDSIRNINTPEEYQAASGQAVSGRPARGMPGA
jgi:molybdopterin-guanine dinucleotide biosynthesis protein A